MSALVGMMVGSRESTLGLVRSSIVSIMENIGDSDTLIVVAITPWISKDICVDIARLSNSHYGKILIISDYTESWASFANLIIEASHEFKWVIFAHDDIQLLSEDLVPSVEKILKYKKDSVGWISFLDMDYLRTGWAPSVREGFHMDAVRERAWIRKKVHHYHTLPDNWYRLPIHAAYMKAFQFDIPLHPVRCHAPFSHFIMIESDKLKNTIKRCEDWSPASLLIDEDWGLVALRESLYNIWIPELHYIHVRKPGGTRACPLIEKYGNHTSQMFAAKWGFTHKCDYSPKELLQIGQRYKGTLIPWSMDKRSFEWDYVK
jgi:hypothetical protein